MAVLTYKNTINIILISFRLFLCDGKIPEGKSSLRAGGMTQLLASRKVAWGDPIH